MSFISIFLYQFLIYKNIRILMTSVLLRQFIEGRKKFLPIEYSKIIGMKKQSVLDKIIPGVSKNLQNSSFAFLEAVMDLDDAFVQETATKGLQKRLLPEIQRLKNSDTTIKFKDIDLDKEEHGQKFTEEEKNIAKNLRRFMISPYVVFGTTMQQRLKSQNPWENIIPIASNRFIYKDPKGFSIRNIMNQQVYGFNCFLGMVSKGFEITQGGKTEDHPPQQTMISFETDADNYEFFVSDFNLMVRQP